jgi:carboxypeptidase C (cathepsin A)
MVSRLRFSLQMLAPLGLFLASGGHALSIESAAADIGRETVTTHHTIQVNGSPLYYTARAGLIPLLDEPTGEVRAKIFFVSYTVEPRHAGPARPLTFYTSGGPPEPATLVDLGPRSLKGVKVRGQLRPPYQLADNQETWLTFTDLVLIDPVGTGYSRATRPDHAAQYYNPDGDANSIAQFIQRYVERYDSVRRQSIFIAGTSYGSTRSTLIADLLAKRGGPPLRGLILISSTLGKQPVDSYSSAPSDLGYTRLLPTFTATAFFHKRLPAELQRNFDSALAQAEAWAVNEYPKILAQTDRLTPEQQQSAATDMARLTGISPQVVLKYHFRIQFDTFLRQLLGADWPPIGLYDSRIVKDDPAASGIKEYGDLPSLYLGGELQYKSKIPYASGLDAFVPWIAARNEIEMSFPLALMRLQDAMRANRSLWVLMTNGYYDSACPYFGTKMAVRQLDPDLRARVIGTYYNAGHFLLPEVREAAAKFIHGTSAASGTND